MVIGMIQIGCHLGSIYNYRESICYRFSRLALWQECVPSLLICHTIGWGHGLNEKPKVNWEIAFASHSS